MNIKINNENIKIEMATNFFKRFKGFMFKKSINKVICFPKCNSIHTFFMFKAIDVIMTDKDLNILYIYRNLKPWKVILPKKNVYYTFEFPVNKYNLDKERVSLN